MPGTFSKLHPLMLARICPTELMVIALAAGMLLAPLSAVAQPQTLDPAPTRLGNLPPGFYPAPPCKKPVLEKEAEETRGMPDAQSPQIGQNNNARRAERFNNAVDAYNRCAKLYIQQAQYDIELILSTVNASIAEVRDTAPPIKVGNLPADFYPRSPCVQPDHTLLGVQPATNDSRAMTAYNVKVENFNRQAVTFNFCMKDYRDKAQHDIQEIRATIQPATAGDNIREIPTPINQPELRR
jgi:hypothetical protein